MVLGTPSRIVSMSDPAFTGVDAQTSMIFGYDGGAQALLTCTLRAKSPTRAAIVGTEAPDRDRRRLLRPGRGDPDRRATASRPGCESDHQGRGLRHQADAVARHLAAGELESPVMGAGRDDRDHADDGHRSGPGGRDGLSGPGRCERSGQPA